MPADAAVLRRLYVTMLRIRLFEERAAELMEAGEIRCPCHLCIGQEAIAAGVCAALATTDYVWGGHRSHGHYIAKGGELPALMAELYGRETGCAGGRGGSMHLIAPEVGILGTVPLVAATIPLAVGTALASKLRRDHADLRLLLRGRRDGGRALSRVPQPGGALSPSSYLRVREQLLREPHGVARAASDRPTRAAPVTLKAFRRGASTAMPLTSCTTAPWRRSRAPAPARDRPCWFATRIGGAGTSVPRGTRTSV